MNCEGGMGSHRAKVFSYHPLRLVQNDFRNKIIVKLSYLKLYAKQMNRKRVGYSNDPFSILLYRIIYFFLSESTSSCFLSKPIQVQPIPQNGNSDIYTLKTHKGVTSWKSVQH